jgi:ATP-dependent Lon protease
MSAVLTVSIAAKDAIERRVQELRRRDESTRARVAPFLKKLWNPVRSLTSGAEIQIFDDLAIRFPNFSPVIDYWKGVAMASRRLNAPFVPQPVLLGGLPGLGKTMFAAEAAKVMGLHFSEISMATVTASFVISGGSLQWGEGSPGFIAKSLCESEVGNPMMLIDEVDKVSGDSRYNPLGPFYPLLERHSARRFKDEALELELDASNVVWVATANDTSQIPDPIMSRMKYFDIRAPEPDEMIPIVRSIYRGIKESEPIGALLDDDIPEDTIQSLSALLPREARKLLQDACMRAFNQERSMVLPTDIVFASKPQRNRVGFL